MLNRSHRTNQLILFLIFSNVFISVSNAQNAGDLPQIKLVNEFVIPSGLALEGFKVGGLSGIDYYEGKYYAISDDNQSPRYYVLDIDITEMGISDIEVESVVFFKDYEGNRYNGKFNDPEDIRVNPEDGDIVWVSEGKVKKGVGPKIVVSNMTGEEKRTITLDTWKIPQERKKGWGPRHNKTLEGLTLTNYWQSVSVAMEMPLKQDGKKPKLKGGKYPVRFSQFNKRDGSLLAQHVYMLDSVARPSKVLEGVALNGLTAILSYDEISYLVIERSYAEGFKDGGNDVKIYFSTIVESTDVKDISSLKDADYNPMTKDLLFDFGKIKDSLLNGVVDNIEGICFGPELPNGNQSLLVISDDNFQKYGLQKTQVILLEIVE